MSNRSQVRFIRDAFTKTDTKPPKALAVAIARAETLTEKLHTLQAPGDGVAIEFTEALLAGRDPYTDKAVLAAVVASHVTTHGHAAGIEGRADEHIAEAIIEHADEILDIWREAFDEAATTIKVAFDAVGDHALEDGDEILRIGGDVAELWAAARKANMMIETILDAWTMLGALSGRASLRPHIRLNRISDARPEQILEHPRDAKFTAWEAHRNGLHLSLPSFDEVKERDTRCAEYQQQASGNYDAEVSRLTSRPFRHTA